MKKNNKGGANATPTATGTKVTYQKDIDKVYEFFRYTIGTTLDCAIATGVLRNSITYYVADLEKLEYPTESRIAVEKKCCHHRKWHLFSHTGR